MEADRPLLSVVATSRNDDHGASLLRRMQIFTDALIAQCRRHSLSCELILVEWNPPPDRPRFIDALRWPRDPSPCRVRIIEVPPERHLRVRHGAALPLFQMIAKNVGIRRARGRFVLATNIDIIFNDALMQHIAAGKLRPGRMYRIDRHDVDTHVPVDAPVEEQLRYCETHLIRANSADGTFDVTPDGRRTFGAHDVADAADGIVPGEGWYGCERDGGGELCRWVRDGASFRVEPRPGPGAALSIELEPGPNVAYKPFELTIVDEQERPIAVGVAAGRQLVRVALPTDADRARTFRVLLRHRWTPVASDGRALDFRVFRMRWAEQPPHAPPADPRQNFVRTDLHLDVAPPESGFRFGDHFHSPEIWDGELFRWVSNDAQLIVPPPPAGCGALQVELEAGPCVQGRPFELQVRDARDTIVARGLVRDRQTVLITLPQPIDAETEYRLHVAGGDHPTPHDTRILNYRVLSIEWARAPLETSAAGVASVNWVVPGAQHDIVAPDAGVAFGPGWDALETADGERFRWVGNDALLYVRTLDPAPAILELEFEGGSGVAYRPFELEVVDERERVVAAAALRGRQRVQIPLALPAGELTTLRLRVGGGDVPTPGDPRALNFRAFALRWLRESSAAAPRAGETARCHAIDLGPQISAPDSGIGLGSGWELEPAPDGRTRARMSDGAELFARTLDDPRPELHLRVSPVMHGRTSVDLVLHDDADRVTDRVRVDGPQWVAVRVATRPHRTHGWRLFVEPPPDAGNSAAVLRVDEIAWTSPAAHASGKADLSADGLKRHALRSSDRAARDAGDIVFGRGWLPPPSDTTPLRRAATLEAELEVRLSALKPQSLRLELEPSFQAGAPGAVEVEIWDERDRVLSRAALAARQTLIVPLGSTPRQRLRLRARTRGVVGGPAGSGFALSKYLRWGRRPDAGATACFHLVDCGCEERVDERAAETLLPALSPTTPALSNARTPGAMPALGSDAVLCFGHGWSAPEFVDGNELRWAGARADIFIASPDECERVLSLEVEPAPEFAGRPLQVDARDYLGRRIATFVLAGRQRVELTPPFCSIRHAAVRLFVEAGLDAGTRVLCVRNATCTRRAPGPPRRDVLAVPVVAPEPVIRSPGKLEITAPERLHTNACGDFTLLAREDWFDLRGYPEFEIFSFHLDSVFCYAAHYGGYREEILAEPMRIYHVEHSVGSGWTPAGQTRLFQRIAEKGIPFLENEDVWTWGVQMRWLQCPIIFNRDSWGFANEDLPETIVDQDHPPPR